jgi:hypothetical protein
MLCQPLVMQNPVKERIVTLRAEIAQISEANRLYLHGGKKKMPGTTGITNVACDGCRKSLNELVALADWKSCEKGPKRHIEIIQRYSSPPVCIGRSFNAISSFPAS